MPTANGLRGRLKRFWGFCRSSVDDCWGPDKRWFSDLQKGFFGTMGTETGPKGEADLEASVSTNIMGRDGNPSLKMGANFGPTLGTSGPGKQSQIEA